MALFKKTNTILATLFIISLNTTTTHAGLVNTLTKLTGSSFITIGGGALLKDIYGQWEDTTGYKDKATCIVKALAASYAIYGGLKGVLNAITEDDESLSATDTDDSPDNQNSDTVFEDEQE